MGDKNPTLYCHSPFSMVNVAIMTMSQHRCRAWFFTLTGICERHRIVNWKSFQWPELGQFKQHNNKVILVITQSMKKYAYLPVHADIDR